MKVLVVANGFPPRGRFGTEFYAGELARGLAARGHGVLALHRVDAPAGTAPRRERAAGAHGVPVELLHVPPPPSRALDHAWRDPFVEEGFAAVLDEERPDVVHFLQLLWGLSLELPRLASERGARAVLTLVDYGLVCHRGQMFDHQGRRCGGPHPPEVCAPCLRRPALGTAGPLRSAFVPRAADLFARLGGVGGAVTVTDVRRRDDAVRAALSHLDAVVAPCPSMAAVFADRLPVPPLVLPYAFDEGPYADVERRPEPGRARFAFLGQLAPHKGPRVLLDAFALARTELAARGVEAELRLFGATPSGRFERHAAELFAALPDGVHVEPAFEPGQAPRVLSATDAVVVPSLWDENAPLVCLEARAAGVPVVGSRVPGIEAVVEEGRHGTLAPPGDAAALARALVRVLELGPVPRGLPVGLGAHLDAVEGLYRGEPPTSG